MNNLLSHIFLVFILLFNFSGFAQSDPFLRIEIETQSDEATYKILPCDNNGLVMFYQTNLQENDYNFWIFINYDKFLQESWKVDIPLYNNMHYKDYQIKGDYLYAFFHDSELKKADSYNFQILKLDIKKGTYEMFSGLVPDNATFVSFDIIENLVLMGFNMEDYVVGIYSYNTEKKETRTVYEIIENAAEFESFFIDPNNNSYSTLINRHMSKTSHFLELTSFNLDGTQIDKRQIIPDPGKKFNTGKITVISEVTKLIIGTFDYTDGNSIKKSNYFTKATSGFFAVNLNDQNNLKISYQDFLDMENMTGYLKSDEYLEAKRKAEKSNDTTGKHSVSYSILLHDVIERDSLFYFVGDAYYEDYHLITNTYYDYYGRAVPVSQSVFDGYRYFNTFISCYDIDGNKQWDNGMEIFNILTFDLKRRGNVYFTGNEVVMAYNHEGKISSKIIKGSKVVEGVESFPIETTFGNDKITEDTKSNMVHWYDNYFIAYGFQTIRNNSLIKNNKRTVFYINKLAFQ